MQSETPRELHIGGIEREGDRCFLLVRCCKGPVRLRDRFNAAYSITTVRSPDGGYLPPERGTTRLVHVEAVKIEAYRKLLEEIHEGSTARIEVVGSGVESLKKGEVLAFLEFI